MKKIATFFLIVTLFYNVLGFYMMFAEQQKQMWVSAMENHDDSHFETIKVNIDPYGYVVDSGFENANHDIVADGISYHVFKKRIQNNVLTLYCLRNLDTHQFDTQIKKVVDSQLFDNDQDNDHSNQKLISTFFKDYIPNNFFDLPTLGKVISAEIQKSGDPQCELLPGHSSINYLPPIIG